MHSFLSFPPFPHHLRTPGRACSRAITSALHLSSLGAIYDVTRNIKTVTKQFQKENIFFFPGNMIKSWKNERPQEREIYDRQRSSSKRSSCESCEIMAKAQTKKHCLWSAAPLLALHDQFTNIGFLLVVHSQLKCFGRILTRDFKSNTLITVLPRWRYRGLSLILNGRQYCLNMNKEFRDVVITSSVTDGIWFSRFFKHSRDRIKSFRWNMPNPCTKYVYLYGKTNRRIRL